jgi:hypothetical protein
MKLGELELADYEELSYYDGPLSWTGTNNGNRYVGWMIGEEEFPPNYLNNGRDWKTYARIFVVVQMSEARYKQFMGNEVTIRQAFGDTEDGHVFFATEWRDGYTRNFERLPCSDERVREALEPIKEDVSPWSD